MENPVDELSELVAAAVTIPDPKKRVYSRWLNAGPDAAQLQEIRQALEDEYEYNLVPSDEDAVSLNESDVLAPVITADTDREDAIPAEGLDPHLVFSSPPTSPSKVDLAPGTPPPAPGVHVTLDDGFDNDDLNGLARVGDYRFGCYSDLLNITAIQIPHHPQTLFAEETFLRLLACSISLSADEKFRILCAVPKLSQFQIDQLIQIFQEERAKFRSLSPKHLPMLRTLEQQHARSWQSVVDRFAATRIGTAPAKVQPCTTVN